MTDVADVPRPSACSHGGQDAPAVAVAQQMLMAYRDVDSPAAKAVALMRNQFGGHPLHRADRT